MPRLLLGPPSLDAPHPNPGHNPPQDPPPRLALHHILPYSLCHTADRDLQLHVFPIPAAPPLLRLDRASPQPPRSCSSPLSTLSPNMRHLSLMTRMSSVSWGPLQRPLHPSTPAPRIAGGLSHCCLAEPPGSQMASAFGRQGQNPPRCASTF